MRKRLMYQSDFSLMLSCEEAAEETAKVFFGRVSNKLGESVFMLCMVHIGVACLELCIFRKMYCEMVTPSSR